MYAFRIRRMTTADGMHPAFSGRYSKLYIISDFTDLYRHLTEIAEVQYTPVTLTHRFKRNSQNFGSFNDMQILNFSVYMKLIMQILIRYM